MVIFKKLLTNIKPMFYITVVAGTGSMNVRVILDTGANKALWYGSLQELQLLGINVHRNDGSYVSASGHEVTGCGIFTVNVIMKDDDNSSGIILKNVDVITAYNLNDIAFSSDRKYSILLPYVLFNQFDVALRTARNADRVGEEYRDMYGKFGCLSIDTLENKVIYNVNSVLGTPIEVRPFERGDTLLDVLGND